MDEIKIDLSKREKSIMKKLSVGRPTQWHKK
jgi:hypothetical protein